MKIGIGSTLAVAGFLLSTTVALAQQAETLRIGTLLPMTGPAAVIGRAVVAGLEATIKDVNQKGGILGRQIELVTGDDAGDPAQGVNEARRLAQVRKVQFVLGSFSTGVTLAAMPVLTEAKVLQFSSAASSDVTVARGPYHFSTLNADTDAQAANFVDYALNIAKVKRVSILSDTSASYKTLSESTRALAASRGLTITSIENFDPRTTDMVPQLLASRRGNPELLWVIGLFPADVAAVMRGVKELNWNVPISAGLGLGSQARAILASMPAEQIPNHVAQNFVGWTYCSNTPVGDAPIPRTLAWLKDRVPDFDKQLAVGLLIGYDAVMELKQIYTGAGTFDTVAAADWIERNSDKIESVVHKFHKIDKTTHFMIGSGGVVMAENPYKVRADGLSKRAGC